MFKVGVSYLDEKKNERYSYKNVFFDEDGWADAKKYVPEDFDLVSVKIKNKKICSAWVNGKTWDGLKIKREDEVLAWKRQE